MTQSSRLVKVVIISTILFIFFLGFIIGLIINPTPPYENCPKQLTIEENLIPVMCTENASSYVTDIIVPGNKSCKILVKRR